MMRKKYLRWGLYASIVSLLLSAGVLLWPLMATPRFWLGLGFALGIVGTFVFTVALASAEQTNVTNEEE